MDSLVERILSSRAGPRPKSSTRPPTSARPITSTGLIAPRTSRGKSAIRRQVQDKTYWIGLIRSKMNELSMEIAVLSKESESMAKEESRINVWQRKAELLAKDLKNMSYELSIYNEYYDRIRMNDSEQEIHEDIEALKEENKVISNKLERIYEEKKAKEETLVNIRQEMERIQDQWNTIKSHFTTEEMERFEKLNEMLNKLNKESNQLEKDISKWKEKKKLLESKNDKKESTFQKEILQLLNKKRKLEKQRNDLRNEKNNGDERARLLAQVKIDNKEILSLENKLDSLRLSIEEAKSTIDAYEDKESTEKFHMLKKNEVTIEEFLKDFDEEMDQILKKINDLSRIIDNEVEKSSKYLRYIEKLNRSSQETIDSSHNISIIDEKRKLELDLNKIGKLEAKINSELESLKNKVIALSDDINIYSDIRKLREDIDNKKSSLEKEFNTSKELVNTLEKKKKEIINEIKRLESVLEENDFFQKVKTLENKYASILSLNEEYKNKIQDNDNSWIKKQALDKIDRYNQKLLGY